MITVKKKQIIVTALILITLVAAYFQYNYKTSAIAAKSSEKGVIGDVAYTDDLNVSAIVSTPKNLDANNKSSSDVKAPAVSSASKKAKNYFIQARRDREIVTGAVGDALMEIQSDKNASQDVKAKAKAQKTKLVKESNQEITIEDLVKNIGYDDALAVIATDGSIDIIVETSKINSKQVNRIAYDVSKEIKIELSKIYIKTLY